MVEFEHSTEDVSEGIGETPETKKAKETANATSKEFVNKTGLPWPFKD